MQKSVSSPSRLNARFAPLASALVAVLISACGGGGSSAPAPAPAPEPEPSPDPTPAALSAAALQGRWVTASGISPARTALVLPAAAGGTELWMLSADLLSLARAQVTTSGSDGVQASGKTYTLPSSTSQVGQAASYSGTASLVNNTVSLEAGALQFTRTDDLTAPSSQSAITGNWTASVGGQTVTLAWAIAANGALSGPSSTGCSYSGNISARSDAAAYNASLTETCNSVSSSFSGIATYRASAGSTPAALTLVMTSADASQSQALVVGLNR